MRYEHSWAIDNRGSSSLRWWIHWKKKQKNAPHLSSRRLPCRGRAFVTPSSHRPSWWHSYWYSRLSHRVDSDFNQRRHIKICSVKQRGLQVRGKSIFLRVWERGSVGFLKCQTKTSLVLKNRTLWAKIGLPNNTQRKITIVGLSCQLRRILTCNVGFNESESCSWCTQRSQINSKSQYVVKGKVKQGMVVRITFHFYIDVFSMGSCARYSKNI